MEISGSKAFIGSYAKGPSLSLQENRAYQANPSYIGTINWLLFEPDTTQTTILDVLWSTYEIKVIVSFRKTTTVTPAGV